mgnify:CR=1 FL=1
MAKINRKKTVPDLGGLLGQITAKRDELPKTPVQTVQPVAASEEGKRMELGNHSKTLKSINSKTGKKNAMPPDNYRGSGGRPSLKKASIEYVKISPRIPKTLKKQVDMALVQEVFQDEEGNHINTLDEVVTLALKKLIMNELG